MAFDLKSVWSDGTYRIVLSPTELIEKLAALVPPRRLNLIRYHAVLAPNAAGRARIVPGPKAEDCQAPPAAETELTPNRAPPSSTVDARGRVLPPTHPRTASQCLKPHLTAYR